MSRNKPLILATLTLFACLSPVAALAQSTEECEEWAAEGGDDIPICEAIKSIASESEFAVLEVPGIDAALKLRSGEGFLLHQECVGTKGGLRCDAWPQEVKTRGHLRYQWSFEWGDQRIDLPESDVSEQSFGCGTRGWVTATLTIRNGKYRVTSSETVLCEKQSGSDEGV